MQASAAAEMPRCVLPEVKSKWALLRSAVRRVISAFRRACNRGFQGLFTGPSNIFDVMKPCIASPRLLSLCFLGLLLVTSGAVRGDFVGPYVLTPPEPGSFEVLAASWETFGTWLCEPSARAVRVDTSLAPTNLVLDTEEVGRPGGGIFFAHAAASGTVSFDYSIAGQGEGSFGWYHGSANYSHGLNALDGEVTNLPPASGTVSMTVQAGDYIGFFIVAWGHAIQPPDPTARRSVTIRNFSAPGSDFRHLFVDDILVAEGSNGVVQANFTLTLAQTQSAPVSVDFATQDGTALAGSDYVATNGTVTFAPGELVKVVQVAVTADAPPEPDEIFFLNLSNPVNCLLARTQAVCRITEVRILGLSVDSSVSFNTVSGHNYIVERTRNSLDWEPVPGATNVVGNGDVVTIVDRGSGCQPMQAYRARLTN